MRSILLRTHGAVAELSLNRPDRLNVLDGAMYQELRTALSAALADPDVNAILLSGQGDNFCAGFDLGSSDDSAVSDPVWTQWEKMEATGELEAAFRYAAKPVVCAVQGHCLGGGFELANSCDFIVAATDAKFCEPEVRFSLVAPPRLMYFVPIRQAKEILLLGENFGAEYAERIGLVNRVTSPQSLAEDSLAFAQRLADLPPETVRHTKSLMARALEIQGIRAVESMVTSEFLISKMTETADRVRFRELRENAGLREALAWIRNKGSRGEGASA